MLQQTKNHLRILQINIRGIKGKISELGNLLSNLNNPEIVILSETW